MRYIITIVISFIICTLGLGFFLNSRLDYYINRNNDLIIEKVSEQWVCLWGMLRGIADSDTTVSYRLEEVKGELVKWNKRVDRLEQEIARRGR